MNVVYSESVCQQDTRIAFYLYQLVLPLYYISHKYALLFLIYEFEIFLNCVWDEFELL